MPSAIVGVVAPSARVKDPRPELGSDPVPSHNSGTGNRMSTNASSSQSSPSVRKKPTPTATINPNNAIRNRFGFHSSPKKITSSNVNAQSSSAVISATVHPPPRYLRGHSIESNKSSISVGIDSPPAKPARNRTTGSLAVTSVASIAAGGGIENNNNNNNTNNYNGNNNDVSRVREIAQANATRSPISSPCRKQRASLSPTKIVNVSSAQAGYMCIKSSTAEDIENAEEFIAALQYCGTLNINYKI